MKILYLFFFAIYLVLVPLLSLSFIQVDVKPALKNFYKALYQIPILIFLIIIEYIQMKYFTKNPNYNTLTINKGKLSLLKTRILKFFFITCSILKLFNNILDCIP